MNITKAFLSLTEGCNLGCDYCYCLKTRNPGNVMSLETAKKIIKFTAENAKKLGKKSYGITLFGGEPSLYPSLISDIISYTVVIKHTLGVSCDLTMNTNGYVTEDKTEEMLELFNKWINRMESIQIQFSVDGIEEVHDAHRLTNGEKGSYKTIRDFVGKFDKSWFDRGLSVHAVLTKESLPHLKESVLDAIDMGFKNVWYMPLHSENWTDEDVELYKTKLRELHAILKDKGIENYYSDFNSRNRQVPTKTCGAGIDNVTFFHDGEIYPCHAFYYNNKEKYMGNINDIESIRVIEEIVEVGTKDMVGIIPCETCEANSFCNRCIAENEKFNDEMWMCFPKYCKMVQGLTEVLKELSISITPTGGNSCGCGDKDSSCGCDNKETIGVSFEQFKELASILSDVVTKQEESNTKFSEYIEITNNNYQLVIETQAAALSELSEKLDQQSYIIGNLVNILLSKGENNV
jgi:uncharacterized protein